MCRRRFAGVLACAAASLLAGFLQSSTVVPLHPDGSSTIVKTVSTTKALMDLLKSDAAEEPFSLAQAKAAAARMGPGVSFVSSAKIDTAGRNGLKTVYAFTDIQTLALTELNNAHRHRHR